MSENERLGVGFLVVACFYSMRCAFSSTLSIYNLAQVCACTVTKVETAC